MKTEQIMIIFKKSIMIFFVLFFLLGCSSKKIMTTDTTKISLENIKYNTFFEDDYSSGVIGGSLGRGGWENCLWL